MTKHLLIQNKIQLLAYLLLFIFSQNILYVIKSASISLFLESSAVRFSPRARSSVNRL